MIDKPARIDIWSVDLRRAGPALEALERDRRFLSAQDRRRALACKDLRARRQRLATYVALRLALERIVGPETAREPFILAAGRPPMLASGGASFSLSHVENYALIGVAREGPLGVDLELERKISIPSRRRDEIIAASTGLAGRAPSGGSDDARFLQAWCRLEAFAKADGPGIGRTLSDLGLRSGKARTLDEVVDAAHRMAREEGLVVRDITLPTDPDAPCLYAAVAMGAPARLRRAWLPTNLADLEHLADA